MYMRKIWIMLLLLFICGMISGNFIAESLKEEGVLLGMEVYKEYAFAKPVFEEVFWQILFERCKCLLIVALFLLTPLRRMIPLILVSIATFMLGFFLMSNMISIGVVGLLISIVTFLPQLFFYGGIVLLLFHAQERSTLRQGKKMAFHTMKITLSIMLFVAGCMVESLLGVYMSPWMIRLSLI